MGGKVQGGHEVLPSRGLAILPDPVSWQHTHLEVRDHSIHELLAEWRVGLKGTTQRGEIQAGPTER